MNLAFDILHFIQAALPTLIVIVVVAVGLMWASQNEKGRLAVVGIALRLLDIFSKGVEPKALSKVDVVGEKIETRLPPPQLFDRVQTRVAIRRDQAETLITGKPASK